jgi:hypothetical protein
MAKATLAINIISDASGASRGLDEASSKVDKFSSGLDKASIASAGVLAGLAGLGKQAFDAASDLQQTTGSINAVFGDWALDIEQSAQSAAKAVGLSTSAYEEMAAVIGSQLKNAGMSVGDATAKTQALIKTGADMAAVFGGTAADAVEALSSALKGEMDPIERYGVSLNQSAIDAQKAADGNDKLTGAADKAAQTQAILELITKQTSQTTGQWSDQMGTAAEQTQIAAAQWDNAAAKLGEVLLPVVRGHRETVRVGHLGQPEQGPGDRAGDRGRWAGRGHAAGERGDDRLPDDRRAGHRRAMAVEHRDGRQPDRADRARRRRRGRRHCAADQPFRWFQNIVKATGQVFSTIWDAILTAIGWVWDKFQNLGGVFSTIFGWIGKVMSPVVDVIKWIADKISWVINAAKKVGSVIGGLFGAPAPAPGGGGRALFGAAGGGLRTAGSLLTAGGGGTSPAAASGLGGTTVNVTVNGALDPVAVGKQIQNVLRDYTRRTGQRWRWPGDRPGRREPAARSRPLPDLDELPGELPGEHPPEGEDGTAAGAVLRTAAAPG